MENQPNQQNEKQTISGFIGKSGVKFTDFESGKRVANFQLATGSKENVTWHNVSAWNEVADKLKDMNLNTGDKLTVYGKNAITVSKTDNKSYETFNANKVEQHKLLKDLQVAIGKVEFKTPKEKEFAELVVYHNQKIDGQDKSDMYRVVAFGSLKDKVKEADLKVGDQLKLTGDARFYEFKKEGGEIKNLVDVNLIDFEVVKRKELSQQESKTEGELKVEGGKEKAQEQNVDPKKKKSKGLEM